MTDKNPKQWLHEYVLEWASLFGYNNLRDFMRGIIFFSVAVACLLGGCAALNKRLGLEDDHAVEERLEEHIEDHTGIPLDLTPDSPEEKKG